jgi:glycine/D-amino acid oxidase-like deaminating enzyme
MPQAYDTIIIGAGITGASTAYHLKAGGQDRVLLMDRGQPASGGTGRSAAIVRQHYSTALMARLAKGSVQMFARMAKELGQRTTCPGLTPRGSPRSFTSPTAAMPTPCRPPRPT